MHSRMDDETQPAPSHQLQNGMPGRRGTAPSPLPPKGLCDHSPLGATWRPGVQATRDMDRQGASSWSAKHDVLHRACSLSSWPPRRGCQHAHHAQGQLQNAHIDQDGVHQKTDSSLVRGLTLPNGYTLGHAGRQVTQRVCQQADDASAHRPSHQQHRILAKLLLSAWHTATRAVLQHVSSGSYSCCNAPCASLTPCSTCMLWLHSSREHRQA
jgi:hypothetical protein